MQPLQFRPIIKRARWGGRRLETSLGKELGPHSDYAESWEIADLGEDQSRVLCGPRAAAALHDLVRDQNAALFGRHAGRRQFPLLIKFIDAHDRLSVQVHPDDAQAGAFAEGENGKTEAWVVVESAPESQLYVGLKEDVDESRLNSALASGALEECLHSFTVQPGDAVFVPAGTVHAIGEGILLAEIQQSSDLTFRLHDWGRLGVDGKPRMLHVEEALRCIDFERGPVNAVAPVPVGSEGTGEELVRCERFVIRRHTSQSETPIPGDDRFHIVMMLEGSAELRAGSASTLLQRGRTVLLPAARDAASLTPADECVFLDVFLP